MPIPVPGWWRRRPRRDDPFTRATRGDLDIVMPPPYDMSEAIRAELRGEVEAMVARLQPNGLDAYTWDVLNNWINARADQAVARLTAERDERQAVGDVLIGLAREEVARCKTRYAADLARVMHAREALELTFTELTGKDAMGPFTVLPERIDGHRTASTLGPIDISDAWAADPSDEQSTVDTTTVFPVPGPETAGYQDRGQPSNGGDPTTPAPRAGSAQ